MSTSSKSTGNSSGDEYRFELRRGPWTLEEDNLLTHYIASHGEGRWNLLAQHSGLRRTGKSCRLRWLNYLKPDVKHGNLTPQEQLMILELHSKWGNRWSKIAQHLPGRTDNEIKNYWRTRVQKQAHRLKIDSNSTMFQDLIQSVWMPQLLQKIQKSSIASYTSPPQNSESQPLNHAIEDLVQSKQVQAQAPLDISATMYNLDHHAKNSSLERSTSPSGSSSESMNIKHIHEISEYPTMSFHDTAYNVENVSYGMENFGLAAMSVPVYLENPINETNWIDDDLTNSLWNNIDELWQFRQLQERSS